MGPSWHFTHFPDGERWQAPGEKNSLQPAAVRLADISGIAAAGKITTAKPTPGCDGCGSRRPLKEVRMQDEATIALCLPAGCWGWLQNGWLELQLSKLKLHRVWAGCVLGRPRSHPRPNTNRAFGFMPNFNTAFCFGAMRDEGKKPPLHCSLLSCYVDSTTRSGFPPSCFLMQCHGKVILGWVSEETTTSRIPQLA